MRTIFLILLGLTNYCLAQDKDWTKDELKYYNTTKDLCKFLTESRYDTSKREILFSKYVFFVNPKKDTSQNRINYFDILFYKFCHFIDSTGVENLDAKPIRYFKTDSELVNKYKEDLKWAESRSLAYYNKKNPEKALGALLYDQDTGKLVSWIVLNMDGYLFLTPSMY